MNIFDPDTSAALNHGITIYFWDFVDLSGNGNATTISPTITHVFTQGGAGGSLFTGDYSIRLTVEDSDSGFQGMLTIRLTIGPTPRHDLAVVLSVPSPRPAQGQTMTVGVQVENLGAFTETYDLTITHSPHTTLLARLTGQTISPNAATAFSFSLNTTNLLPGNYNLT